METIHSLVTKPINQNVAIIRISGPGTFSIIKKIIPNLKLEHNKIGYSKLKTKEGNFIDDILILTFKKPNSFTGEDVIELQGHGNMFIVEQIQNLLLAEGSKQAKEGEFMKQAYINGKIDLSQSEAINSLILSEDKDLTIAAQKNLNKEQSILINNAIKDLSNIFANIQVSIDYPENQDLKEYSPKFISEEINKFILRFEKIKEVSERMIKLSKGIKIAFVGKPNVGKSTLLNRILNEDRSIVTDIQGTTRDVVESQILIDGHKITLQDTAGIRDSNDSIELMGINKSKFTSQNCDILIKLFDPKINIEEQKKEFKKFNIENKNSINVITKNGSYKNYITVNAKDEEVHNLLDEISKNIKDKMITENTSDPLLLTSNQINIFSTILNELNIAKNSLDKGITIDVVALNIETTIKELGKMIGKEIDQDYLLNLFSGFCIGK